MLVSGPVVEDILFGQGIATATATATAMAMAPGAMFIDMASIKAREARDHAARLASFSIAHPDAPVSGGVLGAG